MSEQKYIFLDTDEERKQLVEEIARVRRATLAIVDVVPENQRYEPRYHGWSLAAMLAHLHNSDNSVMVLMQLSLLGMGVNVSKSMNDRWNNLASRIFKARIIETTVRDIQRNEKRINDFILRLPMKQFTKEVFHPDIETNLTIEKAVQVFFLHHWQGHLQTMRQVEGIKNE